MGVLGEEVADAYISVHADTTPFRRDLAKLRVTTNKLFDELGKDAGDGFEKELVKKVGRGSDKAAKTFDTRFIGRLKGSRNDALNIIGSIGGAFENLIAGAVTGGFKALGGLTTKLGESLLGAGEGFGALQGPIVAAGGMLVRLGAAMGTVSATGVGLVVVIAVLAASFAAVGSAVALASTLLSALVGIVVALTASLAGAAAGVLLALGPMALAAAAGVGALVVAFKDLSEEQKAAFDPLKKTFKDVQKVVREKLFKNLADQIEGLNRILETSVAPLLTGAAEALSGVIDYMIAAFERPEVKASLDTLSKTLPGILTSLGSAFTDLTTGLTGFFSAIAPSVGDIATKIAEVARHFSEWANSAGGQSRIKDFFDKAWASASILWGVIKEVGEALGILFTEGQDDGDSMIAKIGDIIGEFNKWAEDDANRQKIRDWFDNAKEVAGLLWQSIEKVSGAIIALDTPENREALKSLLRGVNTVLDSVVWLSGGFRDLPALIAGVKTAVFTVPGVAGIWGMVDGISLAFRDMPALIAGVKAASFNIPGVAGIWTMVQSIVSGFTNMPALVAGIKASVFNIPGVAGIWAMVQSMITGFASMPALIAGIKSATFNIPGVAGMAALINGIVSGIKFISGSSVPNPSGGQVTAPGMKAGGILNSPTRILAGEAGREMVVPLVRPLSQVDPSVRAVSAFARGLDNSGFNGGSGAGKVVNIHSGAVQVTAATDNEVQVANAVLDRLVARWK